MGPLPVEVGSLGASFLGSIFKYFKYYVIVMIVIKYA